MSKYNSVVVVNKVSFILEMFGKICMHKTSFPKLRYKTLWTVKSTNFTTNRQFKTHKKNKNRPNLKSLLTCHINTFRSMHTNDDTACCSLCGSTMSCTIKCTTPLNWLLTTLLKKISDIKDFSDNGEEADLSLQNCFSNILKHIIINLPSILPFRNKILHAWQCANPAVCQVKHCQVELELF